MNILEEYGYSVIGAMDGENVVAKYYIENQEHIKLLLLNVIMIMPEKTAKRLTRKSER